MTIDDEIDYFMFRGYTDTEVVWMTFLESAVLINGWRMILEDANVFTYVNDFYVILVYLLVLLVLT